MSYAIISIGTTPGDGLLWAAGEGGRVEDAGRSPRIDALPRSLGGKEKIILILPGDLAATRRLRLPVRGERVLSEAAKLAFEDILAEPVEHYTFGFGPVDEDGQRTVSALLTDYVEETIDLMNAVGLDPDVVTVDHAVLSQPGQETVVMEVGSRLMASLPAGGLSGSKDLFAPLINEMVSSEDVLTVLADPNAVEDETKLTLTDDLSLGAFLYSAIEHREPANFRRGFFAKQRNWVAIAKGWKRAGLLMAGCFALWLVSSLIDTVKHNSAADDLYDNASAAFTQAFPGTPVRDLRRQALQRQTQQVGSAFLPLSAALTEGLELQDELRLTGIRYSEQGELVADLSFPNAASLEELKTYLIGRGLQVREGGNLRRDDSGDYAGQLFLGMNR